MQRILDEEGTGQSARQFAQAHGVDLGQMFRQPDDQTNCRRQVQELLSKPGRQFRRQPQASIRSGQRPPPEGALAAGGEPGAPWATRRASRFSTAGCTGTNPNAGAGAKWVSPAGHHPTIAVTRSRRHSKRGPAHAPVLTQLTGRRPTVAPRPRQPAMPASGLPLLPAAPCTPSAYCTAHTSRPSPSPHPRRLDPQLRQGPGEWRTVHGTDQRHPARPDVTHRIASAAIRPNGTVRRLQRPCPRARL